MTRPHARSGPPPSANEMVCPGCGHVCGFSHGIEGEPSMPGSFNVQSLADGRYVVSAVIGRTATGAQDLVVLHECPYRAP